MKTSLPLVAIAALTAGVAHADTFHVANGGADADAGSEQAPWATLQYAAEQVAPGDEVVVQPGNYAGFRLETSGLETSRITFRAADVGVVIDSGGPTGDGIRLQNVSYVTIEGFEIVGIDERGIAHRGATPTAPVFGLIIRGNTVEASQREGMYLSEVADSVIEENLIVNSGSPGVFSTHGIYLANAGSDGTTLRGNTIVGSGAAGIHFNGDASVGGDGIISGLVIEQNVLADNFQNGLNMDGVQDSLIQNNLIYGNGVNGLRAFQIDASAGPQGLHVVNNTIHVPSDGSWCLRFSDHGGGFVVMNNILVNDNSGGGALAFKSAPVGLDAANNAVQGDYSVDGDTLLSLGDWQGLGYGQGSFTIDQATTFEDVSSQDYRALADASAIDTGVDMVAGVSAPATDIRGVDRPTGAGIDVGAFEYCEGDCGSVGTGGGSSSSGSGGSTSSGSGGSSSSSAGVGGSGAGASPSADGGDDSGCGCSLPGSGDGGGRWGLAALAALALGARRHRRRCALRPSS